MPSRTDTAGHTKAFDLIEPGYIQCHQTGLDWMTINLVTFRIMVLFD